MLRVKWVWHLCQYGPLELGLHGLDEPAVVVGGHKDTP